MVDGGGVEAEGTRSLQAGEPDGGAMNTDDSGPTLCEADGKRLRQP